MNKKFSIVSILFFMSLFNFTQTSASKSTSQIADERTATITLLEENIQRNKITENVVLRLVDKMESEEDEQYLKAVLNGLETIQTETTDCSELITDDMNSLLCRNIRTQQDAISRPMLSYAEMLLLELAGVDIDNDDPDLVEEKMAIFWKKNYKCLECLDVVPPYPRGNYLKQLASESHLRMIRTYLRAYRFPPNIIDESDGCTVLDYVDAKISDTPESSTNTHEYLQKVRALLIREGAKHANDLGGKC